MLREGRLGVASKVAIEIRNELGKNVSDVTVRCALQWEGFSAHVQQKMPLLTRRHVQAHVGFAHMYANWTVDDWKCVIFNDETKVNMFNSDGRSWCWITNGEHVQPQHVQQTLKHGGGHIIIWGCMTTFRPEAWHSIEDIMDQHMYKFILENFLWFTIMHYNLVPNNFVFQ